MNHPLSDQIRDAGYETLFLLGGFLALSIHPTQRNANRMLQWVDEAQSRRQQLRSLQKRGFIESYTDKGKWVPRLTRKGRAAFAGGRHPEERWERSWDQTWRLLAFDLPRTKHKERLKLRRWLCANHFGRLQGSVWISPDPVLDVEDVVSAHGVDSTMVMVFEGAPAGQKPARAIPSLAWNFPAINSAYQEYMDISNLVMRKIKGSSPSTARLHAILGEDREKWWSAVRMDPLLPKTLHPKGYLGPKAWRLRKRLLKQLNRVVSA